MHYLIDANNLAGKLGLLGRKDFDRELIAMVKCWPKLAANRVTLVFDPADLMGDRRTTGNLTVVYTPRDDYYRSADDKLLELAGRHLRDTGADLPGEELAIVTDDRGLKEQIAKLDPGFHYIPSQVFADKLQKTFCAPKAAPEYDDEDDGSRGLSNRNTKDINDELLRLWK